MIIKIDTKLLKKEDILEVLDAVHSSTMEDCGADKDIKKSSPALILTEKILDFANRVKD